MKLVPSPVDVLLCTAVLWGVFDDEIFPVIDSSIWDRVDTAV